MGKRSRSFKEFIEGMEVEAGDDAAGAVDKAAIERNVGK